MARAPDGKLTGVVHEGTGETSRYEQFTEALTAVTDYLYSCPNVRTQYRLAQLDTGTPNHMRGPGEASGIFALESAMDELSYELGIDPIELEPPQRAEDRRSRKQTVLQPLADRSATNLAPSASAGREGLPIRARCATDAC